MTNRYTIGLAALLLVALTATWYVLAAPSRGSSVEPGATGVVVNAVQIGTGGWLRYQLTVSNVGDQDWSGDVRLVNRQPGGAAAGRGNLPGLPLPAPLPVGQGQVPSTAPDAALLAHILVAARHQRVVYLTGGDRYTSVEIVGRSGQVLYAAPVEVSSAVPLAVLSDLDTAASALAGVHVGDLPLKVLSFSRAADFPASLVQLGSFAAIVVNQFDMSGMSAAQLAAIRDYVGLGGSLVVTGGAGWRRTLLPLPLELTPLKAAATISESLQPVNLLGATDAAATAPVATGTLTPQARIVIPGQAAPLMLELPYGGGRVIVLTFDPASQPVQGTRLADTSWSEALGQAVIKARAAQGWAPSAIPAPSVAAAAVLPQPPETPLPPPWLLAFGLFAYLLVIGPINLALSRRLGKPDLPWLTIPALAVGATVAFYLLGGLLQGGTRDQELQVVRVGPQGAVAQVEYHELLFNQRGQHVIDSNTNTLLAPMTLSVYQWTSETCAACAAPLRGLPLDVGEHVVSGSHASVVEDGVAHGNVRVVGAATGGHAQLGIDAHLSFLQGHVQGRLANLSNSPLAAIALYTFDGETFRRTYLAANLAPGEETDVSATPQALRGGSATAPAGLMDAIAQAALSADPQPVILAYMEPLKSHLSIDGAPVTAAAAAVLQQPARIQAADSQLRDWAEVRLAAATGDQRTTFTSVYDINLPATPNLPMALTFDNRQHGVVEVYDWRTGTWRNGPWNNDPQNAVNKTGLLTAAELSGGTVRVRVKEPRLTWGAFINVEPASVPAP